MNRSSSVNGAKKQRRYKMGKFKSIGGRWVAVDKPVEITIEDKPVVIEKPVVEEPVVKVKEEAVKVPKKRTYKRKK